MLVLCPIGLFVSSVVFCYVLLRVIGSDNCIPLNCTVIAGENELKE